MQTRNRSRVLTQLCCVLPALFILHRVQAQPTAASNDSIRVVQQAYQSRIGGSSLLYNGPEYTASYPETNGSPFLGKNPFNKGIVCYEGICYYNIPLELDLVAGLLLTKSYQGLIMVLMTERVDSFSIDQRKFVRLQNADPSLASGYYEKLYDGRMVALVKRSRQSVRSLHVEEGNHFVDRNNYVIQINNHFYSLVNKKSFLKIFHSQSKELKKLWRAEGLDYKKDPEKTILRTGWWYSQQKNGG